ncbi:MAG: RDD family protein [Verrucomicrobiae bacterium]|nr:RDD family protein [Verrucomicrobiae bacterium]
MIVSSLPRLRIRTPDGIVFAFTLAGLPARFLAWFIDLAVIMLIMIIVNMVLGLLVLLSSDLANALMILSFFFISIGYGICMEWGCAGQTFGKRLMKIRVMDAQGLNLHFSQVVIRNLLRPVDQLPFCYFVGALMTLLTRHCQRLGDLAANTVVVCLPTLQEPDLAQVTSGKYNSFRDFPHLAARLRQKTSPAEADTALQAVLRRGSLAETDRVRLFGELADHFRQHVEFPPEVTEGLSDEQYIRNIVDLLYRDRTPNGAGE